MDVNGKPLNDPIPDTLVDPATGDVVSCRLPDHRRCRTLSASLNRTSKAIFWSMSMRLEKPIKGETVPFEITLSNYSKYPVIH